MNENQVDGAVDTRPGWLINVQAEGTHVGQLDVDGKEYKYTIVKKGLAPQLPYTVGFRDENSLFISEDVPEEDRSSIMTHEVREKTRFADLPEEERCKAATKAELEDVQARTPNKYPQYVAQRAAFFNALVELYEQPEQAGAVTPQFREAIQEARTHLMQVQASLPENPLK